MKTLSHVGLSALCWLLCVAGSAGFCLAAAPPQNRGEDAEDVESIFLPAPRALRQHLARAKKSIEEQRFGDAVSELGALLTSPELNQGGAPDGEPQDFFLGANAGIGTQTSLKTEAQRLLGLMPARGRDLYELQYGAEAKALLDDAVQTGNVEKLNEVARRYFHTRAGYEATVLLGRLHLDRGRPLAAALCWRRVLSAPAAGSRFDPELSVMLAAAYAQANRPEDAAAALRDLRQRMPQAQLRVGADRTESLPAAGQELPWLETYFVSPPVADERNSAQWAMYRGNPARNATAAGDVPLRTARWQVASVTDPADERLIAALRQGLVDEDSPIVPTLQPLAVADTVLMRSTERLVALDFQTGKRIWEYPWWQLGDSPAGRGAAPDEAAEKRKLELKQRLWYDAAYGQLSSDGESVFLLDEPPSAAATAPRWGTGFLGGFRANAIVPQRQLVALNLKREGAQLWMVGGETGLDEPRLAGAFFLGPPLPLFGQLYALAEVGGEIRLVVLDAQTGRQEWSQQLAHVDSQSIADNPQRRLAGASPSFADGVVVCPTSAGAVVAVDMATRSLLWGFQYAPVSAQNRNFGMLQAYPGIVPKLGSRWMDGTVTVAEGAVLLTPPESNKLFCLDLLTGELKWPPRERSGDLADMLYVACVHEGRVVLVGRTQVTAIQLRDGASAWAKPVTFAAEQREMPSGRGYYSDQFYYLPTTAAELLKVDLRQGQVVQRAKTDRVLGNLICHRDQVVGLGVDGLATYHQMGPLRLQVAARLAKSAADPWALARQGELLVNDGDVRGALQSLRKAFELRPEDQEVRNLLVHTFLLALREDFAGNQDLAARIEPLMDDPASQTEYLRILSDGAQALGDVPGAWAALKRLADVMLREGNKQPSLWELAVPTEPARSVRQDCWFQAKFDQLLTAAEEPLRMAIDADIADRLRTLLAGPPDDLRRFVALFGRHPRAQAAHFRLGEHYVKANQWLAAEMEVAPLQTHAAPTVGGAATAQLARIAMLAGHHDVAADYYRSLRDKWPTEVCCDGKTGGQLFEQARAHAALRASLDAPPGWKYGRVKVDEAAQGLGRQTYRRVYPVPLTAAGAPTGRVASLVFDAGVSSAVARDNQGKTVFPVKFTSGLTFYSQQPGMSRAATLGNLLVVTVADQLAAVDGYRAALNEEDAILWRESLTPTVTDLNQPPAKSIQRAWNNPFDPGAHPMFLLADSNDRPLGQTGPVTHRGVYYQKVRTLVCADPLTGGVRWTRGDIPQGADVFGDDEMVCAVGPETRAGLLLSALDGRLVRRLTVDGYQRRWTTCGCNLLTWDRFPDGVRLALQDATTGDAIWSETYLDGARGCLVGADAVAVCSPDGRLRVRSLRDQRVLLEQRLRPEKQLYGIRVWVYPDQYLLCTLREPAEQALLRSGMPIEPLQGHLYAFDRGTGQPQWQVPAYIDGYSVPHGQPLDSPAIWFLRQYEGRTVESAPGMGNRAAVLCLDRRTGRVLMRKEDLQSQISLHEIMADRTAQTSSLSIPGHTFTLTFTEEPTPPEPPAQTGVAASDHELRAGFVREFTNSLRNALTPGARAPSPFDDDTPRAAAPAGGANPAAQERDPRPR